MTKKITRLYIRLNDIENYKSHLDFENKPYPEEFMVVKTISHYSNNSFVFDFDTYYAKYMNILFMKLYEEELKKYYIKEVIFLQKIDNFHNEDNEILEYKYIV